MNWFCRAALAALFVCGLSIETEAAQLEIPYQHCLDDSGDPVSGCRAYTFQAQTSTIYQTFSDAALTTNHGDFVTADSTGRFPETYVAATQCVKISFRLSDGTTELDSIDNVCPTLSTSEITSALLTGTAAAEAVGTSGNALGKLNTANTYSALQTFNSNIEVNSTSAAATAAPTIRLSRDSASPAIDDVIGEIVFDGKDDAAADVEYSYLQGVIIDETDTEEDGALEVGAILAGSATDVLRIGSLDSSSPATVGAELLVNDHKYYFNTSSTRHAQRRCTLVESQTASNDATLDFETIPTGAIEFRLEFGDLVPATDDVLLFVRVKEGGSFQSDATDYDWTYRPEGGSPTTDTSDSEIEIGDPDATHAIGSAAGEFVSGEVVIRRPLGTSLTKIISARISYEAADGTLRQSFGAGRYITNSNALQGVQLLFESGNLESGTVSAYACFD